MVLEARALVAESRGGDRLTLLAADGSLSKVELAAPPGFAKPTAPLRSRVAYAAAHVVPVTWADNTPCLLYTSPSPRD